MKKLEQYLKEAEEKKEYIEAFKAYDELLEQKIAERAGKSFGSKGGNRDARLLRTMYSKSLLNDMTLDQAYWIINEWGGIRGFKKGYKTTKGYNGF